MSDVKNPGVILNLYHIPFCSLRLLIILRIFLQLAKQAKKSNNVDWISIPTTLHKDTEQYSACSVAGWGQTGHKKARSDVLLETNVTILNSYDCSNSWDFPNILCTDSHRGGFCQVNYFLTPVADG